jgi:sporulation protein YqfC
MSLGKGKNWLQRMAEEADLLDENIAREPILELCGNSRVLIENHCGVVEYGPGQIRVKIKNGDYTVRGSGLHLCRMCSDKLLIRGRIEEILVRKGRS